MVSEQTSLLNNNNNKQQEEDYKFNPNNYSEEEEDIAIMKDNKFFSDDKQVIISSINNNNDTLLKKNNLSILPKPILYKYRWIILAIFSLSSFLCSFYQTTFSSISTIALHYWNIPDQTWKVNMMSLIYLVMYVPMSGVSSYLMKHYGVKKPLLLAMFLNFIGGWIRFLGYKKGSEIFFWVAFIGQTCTATAQPLITNAPTLVANNWFGEKERTTATTIATFVAILGSGVAFGVGPLLVSGMTNNKNQETGSEYGMLLLLGLQALLGSLVIIIFVSFFKEKPATPPTFQLKSTASLASLNNSDNDLLMDDEQHFFQDIKSIITNIHFLLILVAYSIGYGVLQCFITILDQVIVPKGYTEYDGSIFGIIVIVAGCIGATGNGFLTDYTKKYKLSLAFCGFFTLVGFAGFSVVMLWTKTTLMYALACISVSFVGMFSVPIVPLCLEISCEISFPVKGSTSAAVLYSSGTMTAAVVLVALDIIQQFQLQNHRNNHPESRGSVIHEDTGNTRLILWISLGLLFISFTSSLFFNGKYKRMESEKMHKEIMSSIHQQNENNKEEQEY
ncbi:hypothetical protein ABK040_002842 [Willaertia magna]